MQHQQNRSQPLRFTLVRRLFTRQQFLKWVGFSGGGLILSNWLSGGNTVASQPAQLTYNVENYLPRPMVGFGGQLWLDDEIGLKMALDKSLGWFMVRLPIEDKKLGDPGTKPLLTKPINTRQEYDTHWKQFETKNIKKYNKDLKGSRIISIYAFLHPEHVWLDDKKENFKSEYINEFAEYWAAHVRWMYDNRVFPEYIELHNEPDYKTEGVMSPHDYNELVKAVRKKLDERSCNLTHIVGPGIAHFDITPSSQPDEYIKQLDQDGVKAISAWSLHSYEWGDSEDIKDPKYARSNWKDDKGVLKSIRSQDQHVYPNQLKDIFLTEHSTKNTTYVGRSYHNNDNSDGHTNERNAVSNLQSYGVRVFENALAFINRGVNGIIVYQARDQSWDHKYWGLDTASGRHRPVYYAMKTLSSAVPRGALVLQSPSQDESDIYAAAFIAGDQFIAAFANGTNGESAVTVKVNNANLSFLKAEAVTDGKEIYDGKTFVSLLSKNSFTVKLPPDSTLVVKFRK